jgi:hypothetical protein
MSRGRDQPCNYQQIAAGFRRVGGWIHRLMGQFTQEKGCDCCRPLSGRAKEQAGGGYILNVGEQRALVCVRLHAEQREAGGNCGVFAIMRPSQVDQPRP